MELNKSNRAVTSIHLNIPINLIMKHHQPMYEFPLFDLRGAIIPVVEIHNSYYGEAYKDKKMLLIYEAS